MPCPARKLHGLTGCLESLKLKGICVTGGKNYDRFNRYRRRYRCVNTSRATEAIARQPEAKGAINSTLILGCALAEATAIYGLVVALVIILIL